MGWWGQSTDGTSFAGEDLVWGDGPADIVDNALDKIAEEFRANWGRDPWREEILSGVNFSARVRFKSLEEATLVAEFDVSQLSDAERDQLALELAAQAERSDAHPSVPEPKITITKGGTG
jgi:hypothetical protein